VVVILDRQEEASEQGLVTNNQAAGTTSQVGGGLKALLSPQPPLPPTPTPKQAPAASVPPMPG